ncbi:arsenate reductase (glutaredoxin) [Winogradskyella sp. F6397]|uniref:Arsenate reductase (Glutaredoxin) n=1 Tax=Winogradskyella marina TaxID=2785530 RepID=A0ABS0EN74_9FLAO|nr:MULTISPECIES: arsenate reductase (glutaredoxin) [Winogradskyella]MBF8151062.1 arsenate reductase (glutaredoxin) [Winogradskyella marina]
MIKIYHNPRCSKSRQGLSILEESGKAFETIKYLENDLTSVEIQDILIKLDIKPIDLIRKNEAIWKSDFKGKELTDNDLIAAMVNHPKLIERPIVINGDNAVIGRPPEAIKEII